jgi:Capsule biosynthesis CapC
MGSKSRLLDFFRSPTVIGLSVGGGIVAAYAAGGVPSLSLAKIILFTTWILFLVESYHSKWIGLFGRWKMSIFLVVAFCSGLGSVLVCENIGQKMFLHEAQKEREEVFEQLAFSYKSLPASEPPESSFTQYIGDGFAPTP